MPQVKGEPHPWFALFLRALAAVVALVIVRAWLLRRFVTYEVRGESMLPTFSDGDFLVARRLPPAGVPAPGDVVLALDPRDPGRTLLKRIAATGPAGQVTLLGDNPAASTDSRTFGDVPAEAILARVCFRYWPLGASRARSTSTSPSVGNASSGGSPGAK